MSCLILASASPRRHELLEQMGVKFKVYPADIDERASGNPKDVVAALAEKKALAVYESHKESFVLAADTLVCLEGKLLGKPHSEDEAYDMLKSLSGKWHSVFSGVCIISDKGELLTKTCETKVLFDELSEEEIKAYVESGEPMGKAGSYAIQGKASVFVKELYGSYTNVIGLPCCTVKDMLKQLSYS